MKLKKISAFILVLTMILSMIVSCSETNQKPSDGTTASGSDNAPENKTVNVLYVDASATEGGDGSESSPFTTIAEAQAKIRDIKANGGLPNGGITVYLTDGYYDPIVFDESDSGEDGAPITYIAKNKLGANITGGVRLSKDDFKPADDEIKTRLYDPAAADKLLQIDLKQYGLTSEDWGESVNNRAIGAVVAGELFINNERMPLGQYPNEKWIAATATTDGSEDAKAELALDADSLDHVAKWQKTNKIWAHGYLTVSYFDTCSKVSVSDNGIILKDLTGSEVVAHSNEHGAVWFWFYNVLEEIDSPGEYYIDRKNGILYLYEPEDFNTANMVLSVKNKELVYGTNVNYISFKDIAFTATRNEAIRFCTSSNITIDGCLIAATGSSGISADGTKIIIQNCELHNIGSYAVDVSGGDSIHLVQNENLVFNNKIHDFAQMMRTYKPGIRLNGCGGTASHNEIYNAAHTALMYEGQLSTFEYNEIYNVCMETLDCGAFYTGRSLTRYGTKINHNYFHDIGAMDIPGAKESYFRATGIYLDDGLSGVEVYGNLVENTTGRGIYIGGGRDCTVSNNLIINGNICPMEYDSRMWDAAFTDYGWFPVANIQMMLEDLANYLNSDGGDIWKEHFPSMANANLEYLDQDPSDPTLMISPVNNVVTNNIYIGDDGTIYVTAIEDKDFASYNTISGNWIIKTNNLVDYENGNFDVKENANMWKHVPDFKQIQWRSMGLVD